MKKILLFIVAILVSKIVTGQESAPAANNYTETFSNYRAELGTGNFVFDVPLFDIETVNPDFNLMGNLYYNAQAAATTFTAEGIMARGWSADFLPSIYREINTPNSLYDELYYETDTYEVESDGSFSRPHRELNDLFQFNVFGLRGSFRLTYNANNTIDVQIVSGNTFFEIEPSYIMSNNGIDGKNISLNGFTIKDGNGFSYHFDEAEESGLRQILGESYSLLIDPEWNHGIFNGYLSYKKAFLLSEVTDKYQRSLVQYTYKTYPHTLSPGSSSAFTYNQKVIDETYITNKSRLIFTTNQSKINNLIINNAADEPLKKISLGSAAVIFNNKDNIEEKRYQFIYFPLPNFPQPGTAPVNIEGNYLKWDYCALVDPSLILNNEVQNYTAGLLKTIILPEKGKIDVEYEMNTYEYGIAETWSALNYDYVEVPVSYNSANKTYSFFYGTLSAENDESYYLKFHSTLYIDPLLLDENGNPLIIFPGLQIRSNTPSGEITYQIFRYEDQCANGEQIKKVHFLKDLNNTTVVLSGTSVAMSNISNVKVYKKTIKPLNQRISYGFGPSVRVKKIKNTDTGTLISEKIYSYTNPADKKSSGTLSHYLWYTMKKGIVKMFYKYVTVEESGKGKTVYQMNWDAPVGVPFDSGDPGYKPRNIWKYNDAGELIEHQNNVFETYKSSADLKSDRKIKKINSVIKTYEGTSFNEIHTEKVFDTVSMMLTENKITEVANSQTFEEQYTYQKLGNAFYQTGVEKTKNNTELNRSTYAYQQQGSTQAYNLKTVSVAKESRPLEVEREITLYDDYGNVLEYKTKDGMVVSQIWGYNDSKMVAELKNVTYASINQPTITAIKFNSNATTYNEITLVNLLNGLRNTHSNGFVTTYTYKPLIGITSVTDANGRKESYVYDSFNRLWRVFNHEGLIVKEYEYNIKN